MISQLARPGGGFVMVAMDQRESLRQLFPGGRASDADLTAFKLTVARELGPYASGFLIDRDYGFDTVARERLVPCGLIVAADALLQSADGPVEDTWIDERVDLEEARKAGAVAAKFLLLWRDDAERDKRLDMAASFVAACERAGLASVLEGVSRSGHVVEAAAELAAQRPSLYKAQVPLAGKAPPEQLFEECARLDEVIPVPWVVLSQGVDREDFPAAVRAACRAGASGVLAGRAVWSDLVGSPDLAVRLREVAVPRLRELAEIVDAALEAR